MKNKLTNTYLDAVDSLLIIHHKYPMPGDCCMIMANLADAVRALNEEHSQTDLRSFRHDWTPEDLAQMEKPAKSLTLDDLKKQVDLEWRKTPPQMTIGENTSWLIGDFEIRRRK
jgi:hypothetical protein